MLIRNGDIGYWGPGNFKTSAELAASGGPLWLTGAGPQRTVIRPTTSTFNALRINTGDSLQPSGKLSGIGVCGPAARPVTKTAGILLDNSTLFVIDSCQVSNCDIGFDFINNCYNSGGFNLSVPRFGTCNVGIYLRRGSQSGSDMKFFNCFLFPWLHAVCAEGRGGGFTFFGGQASALNPSEADENGVIMLGWDYINRRELDGLGQFAMIGFEFEGWMGCHAIRIYGETQAAFRDTAFTATATKPSFEALDLLKGTDLKNSVIKFDGCGVSGPFRNRQLGIISGEYGTPLRETDWYVAPAGFTLDARPGGATLKSILG